MIKKPVYYIITCYNEHECIGHENTIHPIDKWYSFLVLSLQKTASLLIAINAQSQKIKLQHQEAFLSFHLYKICSLALLNPFKDWNDADIISLPFHIPQA